MKTKNSTGNVSELRGDASELWTYMGYYGDGTELVAYLDPLAGSDSPDLGILADAKKSISRAGGN